jgi:hypothetical protein
MIRYKISTTCSVVLSYYYLASTPTIRVLQYENAVQVPQEVQVTLLGSNVS